MLNKSQIKMLQTAVRAAGLRGRSSAQESRYRLLLGQYLQPSGAKVISCKQLNNSQLEDMLALCESMGWRMPGVCETWFRDKAVRNVDGDIASYAQQAAIRHLAGDLGWTDNNLVGLIFKMTNGNCEGTEQLSSRQAWGIIECLKNMFARKKGKTYQTLKDVRDDVEGVVTDGKEQTSKV